MKHYQCHKAVKASPMTRGEYNKYRGWSLPADENGDDEGFLVEYIDSPNANHPKHEGYISWSPKAVFEEGYTEQTNTNLNFGEALEALKDGKRITRTGWNAAGQYVIEIQGEHLAKSAGYGFGEALGEFKFNPVFALKNAQNTMQCGWIPSMGDLLANDWEIVE